MKISKGFLNLFKFFLEANGKCIFFAIFGLALALRLILFLSSAPWSNDWPQRVISADSFEYFVLGKSILERGAFSYTWPEPMPNALRLPFYPFFVAITSAGGNKDFLWVTSLVQIILDSVFSGFLFTVLTSLFSRPIGCLGALLYAVNPDAILWSSQIMPESMSVWFMVLAVYGLSGISDSKPDPYRLLLGTLSGGFVPLVKSAWQYFILAMFVFMVWQLIRTKNLRTRAMTAFLCLVLVMPSLLWSARNWHHWGIPSLSVGGQLQKIWTAKLLMQWSGDVKATDIPEYTHEMAMQVGFVTDHSKEDWIRDRFKNINHWDKLGLKNEIASSENLFFSALQDHPDVFLKVSTVGIAGALLSPQNKNIKEFIGDDLKTDPQWRDMKSGGIKSGGLVAFLLSRLTSPVTVVWSLFAFFYLFIFYLGSILGIKTYLKKYLYSPWTIYLLTTVPIFFLNAVMASSRYRLSMLFPLLPIACIGFYILYIKFKENRLCRQKLN